MFSHIAQCKWGLIIISLHSAENIPPNYQWGYWRRIVHFTQYLPILQFGKWPRVKDKCLWPVQCTAPNALAMSVYRVDIWPHALYAKFALDTCTYLHTWTQSITYNTNYQVDSQMILIIATTEKCLLLVGHLVTWYYYEWWHPMLLLLKDARKYMTQTGVI